MVLIPIPELHSHSGELKIIVSRQTAHFKETRMLSEALMILSVALLATRIIEKTVDIYIKLKNFKHQRP